MGWMVNATPGPIHSRKRDPVRIAQEAELASGPVWTGAENLAPQPGFDSRTVQPVASHYNDWAISAHSRREYSYKIHVCSSRETRKLISTLLELYYCAINQQQWINVCETASCHDLSTYLIVLRVATYVFVSVNGDGIFSWVFPHVHSGDEQCCLSTRKFYSRVRCARCGACFLL